MKRVATHLLVQLCETAAMFVFQNIHCSRLAVCCLQCFLLHHFVKTVKCVGDWFASVVYGKTLALFHQILRPRVACTVVNRSDMHENNVVHACI